MAQALKMQSIFLENPFEISSLIFIITSKWHICNRYDFIAIELNAYWKWMKLREHSMSNKRYYISWHHIKMFNCSPVFWCGMENRANGWMVGRTVGRMNGWFQVAFMTFITCYMRIKKPRTLLTWFLGELNRFEYPLVNLLFHQKLHLLLNDKPNNLPNLLTGYYYWLLPFSIFFPHCVLRCHIFDVKIFFNIPNCRYKSALKWKIACLYEWYKWNGWACAHTCKWDGTREREFINSLKVLYIVCFIFRFSFICSLPSCNY